MFGKLLSIFLITSILGGTTFVSAATAKSDDEKDADAVKTQIRRLGTGPDAQIKLKMRDKTSLEGYVREANDTGFILVNPKTGTTSTVGYPQVAKARGNNLSGGVKIALVIGISVALTFLTYKYGRRNRRYGF